jgi:hypothetical protein
MTGAVQNTCGHNCGCFNTQARARYTPVALYGGSLTPHVARVWPRLLRGSTIFASCPLAHFAFCQPSGQFSCIYLPNREPHQISMSNLFKGKPVPSGPCLVAVLNISSSPAANTRSFDVQLRIQARFLQEGWQEGHLGPEGASDQAAKPKVVQIYGQHAGLLCWWVCGGTGHLKLFLAATRAAFSA